MKITNLKLMKRMTNSARHASRETNVERCSSSKILPEERVTNASRQANLSVFYECVEFPSAISTGKIKLECQIIDSDQALLCNCSFSHSLLLHSTNKIKKLNHMSAYNRALRYER